MLTRAFVTGGSGFVGRHLITALRASGVEVRALARSEKAAHIVRDAGAMPVPGDLENQEALHQGMEGCEVVFHLAARKGMWGRFEEFQRVNVVGTAQMLAAARTAGVPRVIYTSTEAVLAGGAPLVNVDETWPRPKRPVGVYAVTKGMAEDLVLAANSPELATVIVRPRLIWGPGDTEGLPQLMAAVRSGRFAFINGGHYLTSTCYVTNVCEGLLLAAERGGEGEIYFLSDGPPVEMRAFLTAWLRTAGVEPGNRSIPRWLAKLVASCAEFTWTAFRLRGSPPLTRLAVQLMGEEVTVNDAKARCELGYVGHISLEEGMASLRASFLSNSSILPNQEQEMSNR
jgi:nucleoside-diphosphate-sugar epimerase